MIGFVFAAAVAQLPPPPRCPKDTVKRTQAARQMVRPRPLGQEPPAQGYRTVLRKDAQGCLRPVIFPITTR